MTKPEMSLEIFYKLWERIAVNNGPTAEQLAELAKLSNSIATLFFTEKS